MQRQVRRGTDCVNRPNVCWEETTVFKSQTSYGRNGLALFALGRETGLRISGFGANTSAGNIPQCYCLRHCCKDNDSKLDMAAELQDTLPETGAHVFSPNGQLVYLSAVVEQGFLQKVTLSKQ